MNIAALRSRTYELLKILSKKGKMRNSDNIISLNKWNYRNAEVPYKLQKRFKWARVCGTIAIKDRGELTPRESN